MSTVIADPNACLWPIQIVTFYAPAPIGRRH